MIHPVLWTFSVALLGGVASAQSIVSGIVVETSTSRPVDGVSVVLVGTLFGTVTGADGRFQLGPVPDGTYVLRALRSGYEPAEIRVNAPAAQLTVRLGEERAPLPEQAFGGASGSFALGSYGARGDPILGGSEHAMRRVAGVEAVRYGTALSWPVVRGLGGGRTTRVSGLFPATVLALPGAGRIDLLADGDYEGGVVYHGLAPVTAPVTSAAVMALPNSLAGLARARALVEAGYQTNLGAFTSAGHFRGRTGGTRYGLHASYSDGSGYEDASGVSVPASFTRTSAGLDVQSQVSSSSVVRLTGRFAGARSMEIPGAALHLDRAHAAALAAAWQTTAEGSILRRLTADLALSLSDAELSPGVPAGEAGDAFRSTVSATVAADLHHRSVDRLQVGLQLLRNRYDGSTSPAGDDRPTPRRFFWPEVSETSAVLTVAAGRSGRSTDAAITGRIGVAGFRSDFADTAASSTLRGRSDVLAGLFAAVTHHRSPSLRLQLRLSAFNRAPSVLQRYSDPMFTVDGPRSFSVRSSPEIAPERSYSVEPGAEIEIGRATVGARAFYTAVREFIAPAPFPAAGDPAGTEWIYENGSAAYWGFELTARYDPMPFVSVSGHVDFVRGTDLDLDESPVMVPPLGGRVDLTAASPGGLFLVEMSSEFAVARDRVAARRGETPADGYMLFHGWLGFPLSERLSFRLGSYNIFNSRFEPHTGPYRIETQARIPGPGRSWLFVARITL